MPSQPSAEQLACLIVARNLGDAVIQSGFLKTLAERGFARRYLVWTRPQVAFLFQDIACCEVVCSQFPLGTARQFGCREGARLLLAAWQIRQRRPSVTLDLIGDVRERLLARLAGSPRHLHIGWAPGHPFARIIRNPFGAGQPVLTIPASRPNVYAAYAAMLDILAPGPPPGESQAGVPVPMRKVARVGLHPFASQNCKLWPSENWRQLIRELLDQNVEVSIFGAPQERHALLTLLGELAEKVNVVAESIQDFARYSAMLDVMVGLDSFAVHMAQRHGIRTVTINAGNPPELWAVPGMGRTLASSGGCPSYPCFNVPKCEGTSREYVCVKSISVRQVIESINL